MSFVCRAMTNDDFTEEFHSFVMETFFQSEPMNQCLKTKIPDEIDLSWFKQVLDKAKDDHLSIAIYDFNSNQSLPIAYAINHHDRVNDLEHSDVLYSSLNQGSAQKHEHISGLITKLHQDIDLFSTYDCENLFHVYFLGVDPHYRQHRLATQLIHSSICLAQEKHFDLIYADVTSDYSLKAFLKHQFHAIKTIDYHSYENLSGAKIFQSIQIHQGCSIVLRDLRMK